MALCSGVALAATLPVLPAGAAPAADPSLGVHITSTSQWGPDSEAGNEHLVGEVVNGGRFIVDSVQVAMDLLDGTGRVLDSERVTTNASQLFPGERASYENFRKVPAGYKSYRVTGVTASVSLRRPNHMIEIRANPPTTDGFGQTTISGIGINRGNDVIDTPKVNFTLLDGAGKIVAAQFTFIFPSDQQPRGPGGQGPFRLTLTRGTPAFASFRTLAEDPNPTEPISQLNVTQVPSSSNLAPAAVPGAATTTSSTTAPRARAASSALATTGLPALPVVGGTLLVALAGVLGLRRRG